MPVFVISEEDFTTIDKTNLILKELQREFDNWEALEVWSKQFDDLYKKMWDQWRDQQE